MLQGKPGNENLQIEEIRAAFLSLDLMKRAKCSYCEVPFVIIWEGQRVIVKIDRLCELADGTWSVID